VALIKPTQRKRRRPGPAAHQAVGQLVGGLQLRRREERLEPFGGGKGKRGLSLWPPAQEPCETASTKHAASSRCRPGVRTYRARRGAARQSCTGPRRAAPTVEGRPDLFVPDEEAEVQLPHVTVQVAKGVGVVLAAAGAAGPWAARRARRRARVPRLLQRLGSAAGRPSLPCCSPAACGARPVQQLHPHAAGRATAPSTPMACLRSRRHAHALLASAARTRPIPPPHSGPTLSSRFSSTPHLAMRRKRLK
jgi:hypothetical protein